ncbi:hypothetical protein [Bradyrhizobium iriomotense]|uniref:Uncharacterized protein n=1 Tax=Bradyrhizobium iriomotense TaxID=441950 RepID=A0ABQ6AUN4_9BRAD|nr:hypothetical protein GCM10007857_26550 [Bradyrhizobium iriomotense]
MADRIDHHQSLVVDWALQRSADAVLNGPEDNIGIGKDRLASDNAEAWMQAGDACRSAGCAWPSSDIVPDVSLR